MRLREILSILLISVMIGAFAVPALAEEDTENETPAVESAPPADQDDSSDEAEAGEDAMEE